MHSKDPFPPHRILALCPYTMFSLYILILCPCTISLRHIFIPCLYTISLCDTLMLCRYATSLRYDHTQCTSSCHFIHSPPPFQRPLCGREKISLCLSSVHSAHLSSLLMGGCVSGRKKEQPENERAGAGRFGDFYRGVLSLSRNRGQSRGRLRAYTARSRWHMEEKSSRFLRNLPLSPCFVPGYGLETAPEGTMSQISPPPPVHFPDPSPRPRTPHPP